MQDLRKDDILLGALLQLRIIKRLGAGGKGVTYLAEVEALPGKLSSVAIGDQVALKIPKVPEHFTSNMVLQQFVSVFESMQKEGMTGDVLRSLRCVAHVHDFGSYHLRGSRIKRSFFAIVQQYIHGETLTERLEREFPRKADDGSSRFLGVPNAQTFFEWANRMTTVLARVHQKGVVHGDVWQNNFIVRGDCDLVLIDFGQAVFRHDNLTRIADLTGTWMAPERKTSVAGDIYALGALLLYLGTGNYERRDQRHPVLSNNDDLKRLICERFEKNNPKLLQDNWGIADIVSRCLRSNENHRPLNMSVVENDLRLFHPPLNKELKLEQMLKQWQRLEKTRPFLLAVMSSRIRLLDNDMRDLLTGLYDLTGGHEQVVGGLASIVSTMQTGDKWTTITVPNFWRQQNLGANGRFLSVNRQALLGGADIDRIFLLTREELQADTEVSNILQNQIALVEELGKSKRRGIGKFSCYFVVVTQELRQQFAAVGRNFGLLRKGRERILAAVTYGKENIITSIQLRTDTGLASQYLKDFSSIVDRSSPLTRETLNKEDYSPYENERDMGL